MSASSSRIIITEGEPTRPLTDRLVDRLLAWWDTGGGRTLRVGVRQARQRVSESVRAVIAPALQQPWIAASVRALGKARRWLALAFSTEVAAEPRRTVRGVNATADGVARAVPPPAVRPADTVTPAPSAPQSQGTAQPTTCTTLADQSPVTKAGTLRCWNCHHRHHVRSPRRGGCFHCGQCQETMLVVDPVIGLTCAIGDADERGIALNREADETAGSVRPVT